MSCVRCVSVLIQIDFIYDYVSHMDSVITPDIYSILFSYLSLQDNFQLSLTQKQYHHEFKQMLRQKYYIQTNILWISNVFSSWKHIRKKNKYSRVRYNNSWCKSPKDPERPILLF